MTETPKSVDLTIRDATRLRRAMNRYAFKVNTAFSRTTVWTSDK